METLMYLLKSAGVLSLFYLIYSLFLKKETLFTINRHFLLIGILAAITVPILQFTKTVLVKISANQFEQISNLTSNPTNNEMVVLSQIDSNTIVNMVIALYIIGVVLMLSKFIFQFFSIIVLLKKYSFESINGYKFIQVPEFISPFSFFNYVVYNPNMHLESELGMILAHEKVHAKQYHSLDVLLSNLLVALQWFNPFAWLYKKSMEENLEFIADQNTVKQLKSKIEYQMALVKASSNTVLSSITNNFYKSFIKKRIVMLNKSKSNNRNALKAGIVLPLLAVFLWSFNVNEVTEYVEIASGNNQNQSPISEDQTVNQFSEVETVANKEKDSKPAEISENKTEIMATKNTASQEKFRTKIDKNTTDARFQEIKDEVKTKYNIDLNYAAIRNSDNEITSLTLSYSGNGNNGNYQISRDESIDELYFFIDADGKTGFWSQAAEERKKERMEQRQLKMDERSQKMGNRNEEMNERFQEKRKEMEARRNEIINQRDEKSTSYSDSNSTDANSKNASTITNAQKNERTKSKNNNSPIFYIDGKETTEVEAKKLAPEEIDRVHVLKDEEAIKKYGVKGANGVIEIHTKKQ